MPGNRLGPKMHVQYVADNGDTYVLRIDTNLVVTGSGLVPGRAGGPPPRRWRPRGVFCQRVEDGATYRKFLICGTNTAPLYATNQAQNITIDAETFGTTGRKGERITY